MTHVNFAMTTLLNGIWQGTFLAAAMWLLLKLLPRLNPTTRFTVLWVTLLAVVALPLGPLTSRVFIPGAQTDSPAIAATNKPRLRLLHQLRFRSPSLAYRIRRRAPSHLVHQFRDQSPSRYLSRRLNLYKRGMLPPDQLMAAVEHPLIRIRSGRILGALEIIWAFLSFVMLVRLGSGYRELRGLKADAIPAPAEWQLRLRSLSGIKGVRRQAQLLVSSHIATPMSLGFLKPAILIPRALFDTLSDSELEHVLLHELAHLRRRDDWTNLAQKLIEAILPIQPAVYWIGYRMSIEREMACDDWVVATTGTAKPYAASLTKVAELSQWEHAGVLAVSATGNRSQLFSRVHHMLDRTRNAAPKLALGPLGAAIAAVGTLIYVGARAPQLIVFAQNTAYENSPQELVPLSPPHSLQAPRAPIAAPVPGAPSALRAPLTPIAALTAGGGSAGTHLTAGATRPPGAERATRSYGAASTDGACGRAAERRDSHGDDDPQWMDVTQREG